MLEPNKRIDYQSDLSDKDVAFPQNSKFLGCIPHSTDILLNFTIFPAIVFPENCSAYSNIALEISHSF